MERPAKRPAQRCGRCGLVSPGSAVRCECGASFTAPARAVPVSAATIAQRAWETVGGALFFAVTLGAASLLITIHGEWPVARLVFGAAAGVALVGAVWAFARIPREQRRWSSVPKRNLAVLAVVSVVVVGVTAYGLHDYLGTTFVAGHDCTSDTECRSSHCFGASDKSPGRCTEFCETDADCPEHMICTLGRSVMRGQLTGGEEVHFCTVGRRAAE